MPDYIELERAWAGTPEQADTPAATEGEATPRMQAEGRIPYSFEKKRGKQEVTVHGQCALVDSVNNMSKPAMVACIQALDGAAGVKRATPKGNKATIKQRLQEMREAERIRRAAVRDSRTQEAEAEAAKLQAIR